MAEPALAGASQFTTMVLAVVSPKTGASGRPGTAPVDPAPGSDQPLVPSALVARTCTW